MMIKKTFYDYHKCNIITSKYFINKEGATDRNRGIKGSYDFAVMQYFF